MAAINTPRMYKALEFIGLETGAFSQLTRQYMSEIFNPKTPDVEGIKFATNGFIHEENKVDSGLQILLVRSIS